MVDAMMLRPPSDAQYRIPGYYAQPDFFYREHNSAIYIDGPPHDTPDKVREDDGATKALMEMGYIVIRFHHRADWREIFFKHPDVFGVPRA
jgi:very-short-patch-repair endonuclease